MKNLMPPLFFKNKKFNIMMHNRMYCFKFWVGIMVVAIFIFGLNSNQSYAQSCTIITSVYDRSVLFGNNEDWQNKINGSSLLLSVLSSILNLFSIPELLPNPLYIL